MMSTSSDGESSLASDCEPGGDACLADGPVT
jgi:hypothetical protein